MDPAQSDGQSLRSAVSRTAVIGAILIPFVVLSFASRKDFETTLSTIPHYHCNATSFSTSRRRGRLNEPDSQQIWYRQFSSAQESRDGCRIGPNRARSLELMVAPHGRMDFTEKKQIKMVS